MKPGDHFNRSIQDEKKKISLFFNSVIDLIIRFLKDTLFIFNSIEFFHSHTHTHTHKYKNKERKKVSIKHLKHNL